MDSTAGPFCERLKRSKGDNAWNVCKAEFTLLLTATLCTVDMLEYGGAEHIAARDKDATSKKKVMAAHETKEPH